MSYMTKRNPKLENTRLFDCIPQQGPCPMNCNQCFYNRHGAFFMDINKPHMPSLEEIGDGIVRVNSGNDSNNQRDFVIAETEHYKNRFFNTCIPKLDFPAPVVFTANSQEEKPAYTPKDAGSPRNLMFVRLRVSSTNIDLVTDATKVWTKVQIPVVLTFMRYYTAKPNTNTVADQLGLDPERVYTWKRHIINSYWCPTSEFIKEVMSLFCNKRLVSLCGSLDSPFCRDCLNCETYYWQTIKRMRGE